MDESVDKIYKFSREKRATCLLMQKNLNIQLNVYSFSIINVDVR